MEEKRRQTVTKCLEFLIWVGVGAFMGFTMMQMSMEYPESYSAPWWTSTVLFAIALLSSFIVIMCFIGIINSDDIRQERRRIAALIMFLVMIFSVNMIMAFVDIGSWSKMITYTVLSLYNVSALVLYSWPSYP